MNRNMYQSSDSKYIPVTSISDGEGRELASDVFYYTTQIANLVFVGLPDATNWVMVDAGMPKHARDIREEAADRFGDVPPSAIILTHGHFDHVGSIVDLINEWDVPVYAHPMEFPFLTGRMSYPKPDTSVEGAMLAQLAFMFPTEPVDISPVLKPLPLDRTIPGMDGWRWIHTPGHSPGHISLFRDIDGILIAGDAFVTVRQDSLYEVIMQKEEVNGPPRYLTTDWQDAWNSVKKLEALNPRAAVTGHGTAMEGEALHMGLKKLVDDFDNLAIPKYGRYVADYDW